MNKVEKKRSKRRLFNIFKTILTLVVLYFVYEQFARHSDQIKQYRWQINWLLMTGSVLLGLLALLTFSLVWRSLIKGFGHQLSVGSAFRIFYLSTLGRYIPGKVWQLIGIVYLAKQEQIEPEEAAASFVLVQLFCIPASLMVFIVAAQLDSRILVDQIAILGTNSLLLILLVTGLTVLIGVARPDLVLSLLNRLLRKLGRPEISFGLDKKVAAGVVLGYATAWILYGLAFWLFLIAVVPEKAPGIIAAVGLFNAAYQVGYLALFAPGGLGPRELVMGLMLAPLVGPIAPAIVIMARLWSLVLEIIAALLSLGIGRNKTPEN